MKFNDGQSTPSKHTLPSGDEISSLTNQNGRPWEKSGVFRRCSMRIEYV